MNKKKRTGMAIPLVLIFATALGIVATYIIKSTMHYNRSNVASFAQLQTHFVARAGVEHAMLKIKYLHRELYDAICLAQGRNPLFDFTQVTDLSAPESAIKSYNPGPIYLYRSGQFTPTRLFTPNFSIGGDTERKWLKTFIEDIKSDPSTFDGKTTNTVLTMKSLPDEIKNRMREPFKNAEYGVITLNIAAQEIAESTDSGESRVSNTAVVEIVVRSSVETAREEVWDYEIRKTMRINRD